MDYEKAYKEALELMKGCIPDGNGFVNIRPCDIFPELKESEDERVREAIYNALKYLETELSWDFLDDVDILDAYAWLKKQGDKDKLIEELGEYKAKYIQEVLQKHLEEQKPAWSEEGEKIRKALIDFVQQYGDDFYSQVSKGRAIAWLEKQKIDPRQKYLNALLVADNIYQMAMNDEMVAEAESKAIDALMKLCITKYLLGKHGEQKQDPCEHCNDKLLNCHNFPCIKKKAFEQGKSTLEVINEEKVDNANKVEPKDYNSIDPHFGKPIDEVEPKFNVGDWIIFNGLTLYIKEIVKGYYRTISKGGITNSYDWGIDNTARLWNIADAKDGDVLATDDWVFIFEKVNDDKTIHCYCHYDYDEDMQAFNVDTDYHMVTGGTINPATKEQRDLLFQKMEEAGYKWDSEKKELKLLITNGGDFLESENCEQKPAWSEEDERNASYICAALDCYYRLREDRNNTNGQEDLDKARNWLYNKLKSLNPHNRWEPSDEQVDALDSTLQYSQVSHNSFEHLNSLFNDLKKLREK